MDNVHSYLTEWAVNFARNKDALSKKIEKIEKNKDGFDVYIKFKDKEQYFIIIPSINELDPVLKKFSGNAQYSIVTLNSSKNLSAIVLNWAKLIEFKFLSVVFVNPFSMISFYNKDYHLALL